MLSLVQVMFREQGAASANGRKCLIVIIISNLPEIFHFQITDVRNFLCSILYATMTFNTHTTPLADPDCCLTTFATDIVRIIDLRFMIWMWSTPSNHITSSNYDTVGSSYFVFPYDLQVKKA